MRNKVLAVAIGILLCSTVANAQSGLRGQIYLPNGAPLHRTIRFTVRTDDGGRNEILFTDSNGRIEVVQNVSVPYTIIVESDDETYATTSVAFDPAYSGKYVTIHLKPLESKPTYPPAVVNVNTTDTNVSPKAREVYESALELIKTQQYEQAVEPLKGAIALQPDYFHAYNDLGVLYMKLNKLDQAAEALRHAIKINDKIYLPHLNLGIVFNRLAKYKEAADLLTKLERTNPDRSSKINPPLIEATMGAQRWADAERQIRKGLKFNELDIVDLKIKLGTVLMRQGKFDDAAVVLREAVEARPDSALANLDLGGTLLQTGSLDEAEALLRRAYEIKGSTMAGAQLLLGTLYFQKKDYPKAIEAFTTYLRDLPDAPNAAQVREAIDKLRQATGRH
jgi:tetratricopeptide (TPR) repeat protein